MCVWRTRVSVWVLPRASTPGASAAITSTELKFCQTSNCHYGKQSNSVKCDEEPFKGHYGEAHVSRWQQSALSHTTNEQINTIHFNDISLVLIVCCFVHPMQSLCGEKIIAKGYRRQVSHIACVRLTQIVRTKQNSIVFVLRIIAEQAIYYTRFELYSHESFRFYRWGNRNVKVETQTSWLNRRAQPGQKQTNQLHDRTTAAEEKDSIILFFLEANNPLSVYCNEFPVRRHHG